MAGPRYQKLESVQSSGCNYDVKISTMLNLVITLMLGFTIGLLFPQVSQHLPTDSQAIFPSPQGPLYVKMEYNKTFSRAPSEISDSAWASLFPEGDGFVQELSIAPDVSTLSVFHQLHCLNSLRVAYYFAVAPKHEFPMKDEHGDPHHVRHCIDYLRQSLICMADTNVEPVNMQLGGSTGWGTYKICRDFGAVERWSNKHKAIRHK